MKKMNTFEIKFGKEYFNKKNHYVVKYVIDGEDFLKLVKKAVLLDEKGKKVNIRPDEFAGLFYEEVMHPSKHLLGKIDIYDDYEGKTQILTCKGCREPMCWPLVAKITEKKEVIIWKDFRLPHREKWKFKNLGPYTFNKKQYKKELNKKPKKLVNITKIKKIAKTIWKYDEKTNRK